MHKINGPVMAPRKPHNLRNRIFFSFLAALLPVVVFCIAAIEIYLVPAFSANARQELHNATLMLKNAVQTAADVAVRNHLKAIAEKNAEIVTHLLGRVAAGEMSLEQAKIRAREILLAQRIGSSGYIYCVDSGGMAVVHPNPGVENTDNTRFAFVREQMVRKQGYIEYEWQNPGEELARPKALYMAYVAGLDWIISVSSYRTEFTELVDVGDFRALVLSPRFGASGYAYVVNQQGDTLIHPVLSDYNALRQSDQSSTFLRTMIDSGSGTIEYRWRNPGDSAIREKIAVYESIAEYGWLIISSSYKSEILGPAAMMRKAAYGATVFLCLAAALISYLLSVRLTRPVAAMIAQLDRNTRQLSHEPLPVQSDDELGRLAGEFNNFLATIEANNDERMQAEEQLRKSEEQFRNLYDEAPVGYFEYDLQGNITRVNNTYLRILGYTAEDMLGQPCWNFIVDEVAREQILAKLGGVRPPAVGLERTYRHKDGTTFPVLFEDRLLFDEEGHIKGVRTAIQDITEHKRAEEERKKLQAQLTQAQKMDSIGRLAGGVAHDFNNMLGVIIGHTQLAMLTVDESHPLFQRLTAIHTAAERSADLTRQLLAFARKQTITLQVLDLNKTVEGMLNLLRRLIGENVTLSWLPGKDLASIKMDPSQIDQILVNLCVNARDAIIGTGQIIIETDSVSLDEAYCSRHTGFVPGDYIQLIVSDTGCGMDAQTLSLLFEPFYTTKETGKGTGLGMAMVYGIVKQNNGFINVYSEPDKGTTFRLYFPRCSGQADLQGGKVCDTVPLLGNETILLVEDGAMILDITRTMLETQGYTVLAAATPEEAINLAKEHGGEINLLLTDVIMPEMNGRDLSRHILGDYPNIKSMFMSGYTADIIAHHGVLDEGVHFIQKPFSMKELGAKLREALEG